MQRIEYIDALRGFVMLLVVLAHVPLYCYHQINVMSISLLPSTFHLALFFFISGWFVKREASFATKQSGASTIRKSYDTEQGSYENVTQGYDTEQGSYENVTQGYDTEQGSYENVTQGYDTERSSYENNLWFTVYNSFKKKFVQLIVPTMVFYLLYCWINGIDVMDNLWNDKYKAGYWFCVVLFVFYLTLTITKAITGKFWGQFLIFFIALAMIMLNTNMVTDLLAKRNIPNILCIQQWQYFIFFYLGYLAHLHQERFFSWLDDGRIMAVAIVLFIGSLLLWYKQPLNLFGIKASFLLWGVLGAALSSAFFRKNESWFSQQTYIGRTLQYVGRRTLDVYMLHFFFLPKNFEWLGNFIMGNGNQTVELFVSLAITIMVIVLCLLTSNIIRLSPLLAHWVLGVKK